MKYLLLVFIVALCAFIGIAIKEYFKKREKFFFDLHTFVYALQLEIEFFEKKLKKIVSEKQSRFDKEFALVLKHFEQFISGNTDELTEKALLHSVWILGKEEKSFILSFFQSLGRSNSKSQLANLEQFKVHFYSVYQLCKNEHQKNGSLSVKLSVLVGVMIAILLI